MMRTRKTRTRKMNKTIYKQLDSRWASLPYPTKKSSFSGNGCGCVACTHIAIEQQGKKNWTPKKLRPWMVQKGYAVAGHGTTWNGITETLKHIGHKTVVKVWEQPMSVAWEELSKGDRIGIILFNGNYAPNGTHWSSSGHYVAFTNYKIKDGKHLFYCKDSGARNHDGWYSYERSMKGCIAKLWIVKRIKEENKKDVAKEAVKAPAKSAASTKKKTNAQKIVAKAKSFCWPYGTKKSKYKYKTGKALATYKTALKKWFHRKAKISQTDCGYFVSTCVRAAGVSKTFQALPGKASDPYPKLPSTLQIVHNGGKIPKGFLKDGDIVRYKKKNGHQHTLMIYKAETVKNGKVVKKGKMASAARGHRFPVIQTDTHQYHAKGVKMKTLQVIRAK